MERSLHWLRSAGASRADSESDGRGESSDDFLRKMRAYSQLDAARHAGRKSSSPGQASRHGLWAFAKSYVLQRGFPEGYDGLVVSIDKARTTFWKNLLLHEANRQR